MILYIANRGEIARRIAKTARRLGWKVAVGFANQDSEMPFVREADFSVSLNGEEALETYLNIDKVVAAAKSLKATHLHPGYGFLSENPRFVDAVKKAGIEFVGPPAEAMRLLGDKIGSRRFLKKFGVSLLPSYEGDDQSEARLHREARAMGYPILIKPSAGGGGKGMGKVMRDEDFLEALRSSQRIALSAFSDDRVFLEKLVEPARHIEVQVLVDKKQNVKTFGERECSLQRRHQKVFEETPCDFLSQQLREKILQDSAKIVQEAKYENAGTVEWIWDGSNGIYFLEVNARLQVEHPVTEMVWGVDLVEWQLRVSRGESIKDLKLVPKGHAIEARLCAEDPAQNFMPSAGKIHRLRFPKNVRIDSGFDEKNEVPPQFDSLLAKVISFGASRAESLANLKTALEQVCVFGPKTNRSYLIQILSDARVLDGHLHTNLLADLPPHFNLTEAMRLIQKTRSGSLHSTSEDEDLDYDSPWGALARPSSEIDFEDFGETRYFHTRFADWSAPSPLKRKAISSSGTEVTDEAHLKSPMPAKVIRVLVSEGEKAKRGQTLVVVEAMKMEHQLKAPRDLTIKKVNAKEGSRVAYDAILVEWET